MSSYIQEGSFICVFLKFWPNHDSQPVCFLYLVTVGSCPGRLVQLMVIDMVFPSQIHGHHKGLVLQAGETEEEFSFKDLEVTL